MLSYEMKIDESDENFKHIIIEDKIKSLYLTNNRNIPVDSGALFLKLSTISNIEKITSFDIGTKATVSDCSFLRCLPNLKTLFVYGSKIKSLDGIEDLKKLIYLKIETKQKNRTIDAVEKTNVTSLDLKYQNVNDFNALNRSSSIRNLKIIGCPHFDAKKLRNMNIDDLSIVGGSLEELGDFDCFEKLSRLTIAYCTKLEEILGNNDNIKHLVVESCNRLKVETIAKFSNLISFNVISCKRPFTISSISRMFYLKTFTFQFCNVTIDEKDFCKGLKDMKCAWISSLKNGEVRELSENNEGVVFTNKTSCYENGVEKSLKYFHEVYHKIWHPDSQLEEIRDE